MISVERSYNMKYEIARLTLARASATIGIALLPVALHTTSICAHQYHTNRLQQVFYKSLCVL